MRPELVEYKAHDGLTLTGWLYRPAGAKAPYPPVLSFHGGPEGEDRPCFNSTNQALGASGMAIFAPNVRGSSGFGKTFVNLDNGAVPRRRPRLSQNHGPHPLDRVDREVFLGELTVGAGVVPAGRVARSARGRMPRYYARRHV